MPSESHSEISSIDLLTELTSVLRLNGLNHSRSLKPCPGFPGCSVTVAQGSTCRVWSYQMWCSCSDERWYLWWMTAQPVMRSPLNLNDKRSQCKLCTHHCSATFECDQVANIFCWSLREGTELCYDFILASLFKYCSGLLVPLLNFSMIGTLIKVPSGLSPIAKAQV